MLSNVKSLAKRGWLNRDLDVTSSTKVFLAQCREFLLPESQLPRKPKSSRDSEPVLQMLPQNGIYH
jgi:hypothetical protein